MRAKPVAPTTAINRHNLMQTVATRQHAHLAAGSHGDLVVVTDEWRHLLILSECSPLFSHGIPAFLHSLDRAFRLCEISQREIDRTARRGLQREPRSVHTLVIQLSPLASAWTQTVESHSSALRTEAIRSSFGHTGFLKGGTGRRFHVDVPIGAHTAERIALPEDTSRPCLSQFRHMIERQLQRLD